MKRTTRASARLTTGTGLTSLFLLMAASAYAAGGSSTLTEDSGCSESATRAMASPPSPKAAVRALDRRKARASLLKGAGSYSLPVPKTRTDIVRLSAPNAAPRVASPDATGPASPVAPLTTSPTSSIEAIDDVMVFSPHNGSPTALRRLTDPASATDYYANRFFTSQLAKNLRPTTGGGGVDTNLIIDALWFGNDSYCSWSRNWRFSVIPEDPANPLHPKRAIPASELTFTAFDSSTIQTQGAGPGCIGYTNVKVELPNVRYPTSSLFAIDDLANDDDFNRPDEPIEDNPNWIECNEAGCFPTTDQFNIRSNRMQVTTGGGTPLAWRLPDTSAADCDDPTTVDIEPCYRYFHDYIDDALLSFQNPDQDVRLTVDYDLNASTAQRAGVFVRGFFGGGPFGVIDYYSAYVDKSLSSLRIDHTYTDLTDFTAPVLTTVNLVNTRLTVFTGTLVVEVRGYSPVDITARVGAVSTTVSHTDPDPGKVFHGDITYGNVFGIIAPRAGGGEVLDTFKVERNADLFLTVKMPAGEALPGTDPPSGVRIFAEGNEEGREFVNTFYTRDGTLWSQSSTVCTVSPDCDDCTKVRNTMLALQVRDATGPTNVYQTNNTLASFDLACCGCSTDTYSCQSANHFLDSCPPVDISDQGLRPVYEVGQPIDIAPTFINEHAPDVPVPAVTDNVVVFAWLVCLIDPSDPADPCQFNPLSLYFPCVGSGCADAGLYGLLMADIATGLPGLNYTTANDTPFDDDIGRGFPREMVDGPLYLGFVTPNQWTPTVNGEYLAWMWEFDDLDGDGSFPDYPSPGSPWVHTDDYPFNYVVRRQISVGGCTAAAYNLDKRSLLMAKPVAVLSCAACGPTQIYASWLDIVDPPSTYDVFEIVGWANRSTIANPYPGTPVAPPSPVAGITCACVSPSAIPARDVAYYAVFQDDNCNPGNALADP